MESSMHQQYEAFEELMSRLQQIMKARHVDKDFGLTASQMFILRFLIHSSQAKASDIARASGLSPGAVTQVCDELVKDGLVERTRSQDDRRVVHIQITNQGRELVDRFRKNRSEKMKFILTRLGEKDATEFVRIIGRVVDIVEKDFEGQR
ncbi:MarR family winged helix-turn-helix transcriptional regulator [Alicyclobacillus mengziensis]|uniref:MarR family transcriptional regulator n=1 Tax=Alicyclobacillus mengziensis TaxID=2931921 RepID=A0A9X7Z4H4_9BACL|nr:MarR family transcriptional regulator [Alicyclobacillus mengziensis]QSO45964.1 MarR family transcriptional regulator [Alicyclobacillus mengziensis]